MKEMKVMGGEPFDFSKTYEWTDGYDDYVFSPPFMVGMDEDGNWRVEEGVSGVLAEQLKEYDG